DLRREVVPLVDKLDEDRVAVLDEVTDESEDERRARLGDLAALHLGVCPVHSVLGNETTDRVAEVGGTGTLADGDERKHGLPPENLLARADDDVARVAGLVDVKGHVVGGRCAVPGSEKRTPS